MGTYKQWPWPLASGSMFPFSCNSRKFVDLLDSRAQAGDKIKIFAFSAHGCTSALTKKVLWSRAGNVIYVPRDLWRF